MANFLDANLRRMQNANQNIQSAAAIRGQSQDRLNSSIRNLGDVFGKFREQKIGQDEANLDRALRVQLDEDARRDAAREANAQRDFARDVEIPADFERAKMQAEYAYNLRNGDEDPASLNEIMKQGIQYLSGIAPSNWFDPETGDIQWSEYSDDIIDEFNRFVDRERVPSGLTTSQVEQLKDDFASFVAKMGPQVVTDEDAPEDSGGGLFRWIGNAWNSVFGGGGQPGGDPQERPRIVEPVVTPDVTQPYPQETPDIDLSQDEEEAGAVNENLQLLDRFGSPTGEEKVYPNEIVPEERTAYDLLLRFLRVNPETTPEGMAAKKLLDRILQRGKASSADIAEAETY